MSTAIERRLTVQQVAEVLGVDVKKVLRFIAAKELRAVDVSQSRGRRPRWRIKVSDLELFEASRANTLGEVPKVERRRRTAKPQGWTEYV